MMNASDVAAQDTGPGTAQRPDMVDGEVAAEVVVGGASGHLRHGEGETILVISLWQLILI